MQKSEFTRLIEDNHRAKRPPQLGDTNISRVPLGSALLRDHASHDGSSAQHYQRLFQSKMPSKCTPANVYNPQSWQDLISRTLNANDLVRGSAIHPSRKQHENLKRTKKVLEPQLQDEVDVLGNKITGCKKKVLNNGGQTFQIGHQYEQTKNSGPRTELIKKHLKSRIFDNLERFHEPSGEVDQVVCVHPNVLYSIGKKASVASRLHGQTLGAPEAAGMSTQKERAMPEDARGMKIRMDYQSKVNCMPNSLTLQYEADKKRSKSSVNILKSAQLEHAANILNPDRGAKEGQDREAQPDLRFQIYNSRSKSTTTKGRRKQFKDQNFKFFERSVNLKEPESEDQINVAA